MNGLRQISALALSALILLVSVSSTLTRMECTVSGKTVYTLLDVDCCQTPEFPIVKKPCCDHDDLGMELDEVLLDGFQGDKLIPACAELSVPALFTLNHDLTEDSEDLLFYSDLPPPDNRPSLTIQYSSFLC